MPGTHYHLKGTLWKEVDGENVPITDEEEFEKIVNHFIAITEDERARRDGSFRFVDFDVDGFFSVGYLSLNWSE